MFQNINIKGVVCHNIPQMYCQEFVAYRTVVFWVSAKSVTRQAYYSFKLSISLNSTLFPRKYSQTVIVFPVCNFTEKSF